MSTRNVLLAVRLLEAGPLSISQLANALGVAANTASRIVRSIEQAGYPVVRERVASAVPGGASTLVRIVRR